MDPKLQAASDYETVEPSSDYTVPDGQYSKGCRIDQAGAVTFTSNAGTTDVWNCLQGERIDLGGKIRVQTDASARVKVYL